MMMSRLLNVLQVGFFVSARDFIYDSEESEIVAKQKSWTLRFSALVIKHETSLIGAYELRWFKT